MPSRSRRAATTLLTVAAATAGLTTSAAAATTGTGADDSGFSVSAALAELPPAPTDAGYWIMVGDLDAATELAAIERPDSLEMDVLAPWLSLLTGMPVYESDPPEYAPIFVPFPDALTPAYAVLMPETAAAVGWSVLDVSWFAAVESPPTGNFAVLHGVFADDALTQLPLVESTASGDVVTLNEGDDMELSLTGRNALSSIGVPTRMARVDDAIALSRTAQGVVSWLDGLATTAADDPALSTIAEALDDAGVHSATIGTTTLFNPIAVVGNGADATEVEGALADAAPMLLPAGATQVGIGWGTDDDGASVITLAYFVLGGPDAVDAAASAVEVALTEGFSQRGQPLSELLTLDSVTTGDTVVVATVRAAEGRSPITPFNMWLSADFPFAVG